MLTHLGNGGRQLWRREEGGGTSTEMELVYHTATVHLGSTPTDFLVQVLQIVRASRRVAGNDPRAAAVKARVGAERHVHIERERTTAGIGRGYRRAVSGFADTRQELYGGRVGRVPRAGPVIPGDQPGVELHLHGH